jgi:hypothetical protein
MPYMDTITCPKSYIGWDMSEYTAEFKSWDWKSNGYNFGVIK